MVLECGDSWCGLVMLWERERERAAASFIKTRLPVLLVVACAKLFCHPIFG